MKRLFKQPARILWRITGPLRRPLIRKFDRHLLQLFGSVAVHCNAPADLELTLSSVVRELARLQLQVEALQQQIDDLEARGRDGARAESRLSVVGEIG